MFQKAKIEIHNLKINDIIVTSTPGFGDDDIWAGEGELVDPDA